MSQTLLQYLTNSNRDFMSAKQFIKTLPNMTQQASFAEPYKRQPILDKPHGYITLPAFFDLNNVGKGDGQAESFVNDLTAFKKQYGSWLVTDTTGDNTYNYGGLIEDNIAFTLVTITDPQDKNNLKDLLLLSVNTSLDAAIDYSSNIIAIFDSTPHDLEHYDAMTFMNRNFSVAEYNIQVGQVKYYLELSTTALSDSYESDFILQDNQQQDIYNLVDSYDDCVQVDPEDLDDVKSYIMDLINDRNDLDAALPIKITKSNFMCESIS